MAVAADIQKLGMNKALTYHDSFMAASKVLGEETVAGSAGGAGATQGNGQQKRGSAESDT